MRESQACSEDSVVRFDATNSRITRLGNLKWGVEGHPRRRERGAVRDLSGDASNGLGAVECGADLSERLELSGLLIRIDAAEVGTGIRQDIQDAAGLLG